MIRICINCFLNNPHQRICIFSVLKNKSLSLEKEKLKLETTKAKNKTDKKQIRKKKIRQR